MRTVGTLGKRPSGVDLPFRKTANTRSPFSTNRMGRNTTFAFLVVACLIGCIHAQPDYLLTSGRANMTGIVNYNNFTLSGTATLYVTPYNGNTGGTLEIRANYIRIGMNSIIIISSFTTSYHYCGLYCAYPEVYLFKLSLIAKYRFSKYLASSFESFSVV